jgi:hypothetical protein
VALNPWDVLTRGGKPALDLLEYCVISVQLEIVVAWLIAEYRNRPTAERALALYDAFLAPGAPARIRADADLPPRELLLPAQIERLRRQFRENEARDADADDVPRPRLLPPRTLFDALLAVLTADAFDAVLPIRETYDPGRQPAENLPGGRMNAGQRAFVEKTWRARVRPGLVRAGFARIATVGG